MELTVENLGGVLKKAMLVHWEGNIPIVPARLRIAVDSLKSQNGRFWELQPDELIALIEQKQNKGVRAILQEYPIDTVAFAIRDARL